MIAHICDLSVIQHYYLICVLYGCDTLSDYDLSGVRYFGAESLAYHGVGLHIHCAGRIVEDEYLWLFQKRSGYTQSLFLTPGDVASSLLYICLIAVLKFIDKFIGAGQLARMAQFFVCSVFVSPSEVLGYST